MKHMAHTAHKARKRFGQNFLVDPQVIAEIIACIYPQPDDRMVEIGPGLGALTTPLLQTLKHLTVIELDRDIVERLSRDYPQNKLTIHSVDALKFDFSSLGDDLRVVGNLPYNISTPLLFHLSRFTESILDMHFMLQKEVVERMVARSSTADYGRLSVMLQYRFEMEQILTVSAASFRPTPKVESAIVCMRPIRHRALALSDETAFSRIVAAAFSQRRKTLRNTLSSHLAAEDFTHLAIDPSLRAENLTVEEYIKIANYYAAKQPDQ
ncbi:16S rRNA (adenine(1518)-N(6)/adenine(1519)-N(6))-dimethyltransferase RsmA [Nitrosomonas sp.]|uniref:16S rRNA (adenine(1518)-N(6)/adenine(1519)-N(6))- dimethyltransferase RsmA n=1 Tax=Nitrosomonas sp. TaxID=42353 RepID=UPI0028503567|nr:16S rRNA (adenine(1518)-N(6)/adenine(1519)-N(6))-dimethyltransferase RsmA [Nitrosomonas sp.]MDR4514745.1 16S rRNA (adenine(1518)-N(6)/adenine(1519)-N(6))-dimethyltransferase RsmA [Nitrosomonas sp.]